ncbi:MAG: LemA family protein [Bacteroidaceae bacterium]|nr:LemA family protein [Bacteroidaceae bacterium]MBP5322914.1 LemA family protein [Bacteroidaceae bacterium]
MKRSTIIVIVILALLVLWGISINNRMVSQEEGVTTAWANVESQYQRRADLIPNLVNTVKGYAAHESETLQAVVNARAKATSISVDSQNMTPEQLKEFQEAQNQVTGALGRLIAVAESYPDLKANENFKELQAQLEGTENRIATERKKYNEVVKAYNTYIRKFPQSLFANVLGFDKKPYFESEEGTEKAPTVEF